ncbi:hypothetical protein HZS_2284 [Henneguya salminicola]|nr:hypothetical protein HZS_2284 [Henneguya salminicola]
MGFNCDSTKRHTKIWCKNNGSYDLLKNTKYCSCLQGYAGRHCEINCSYELNQTTEKSKLSFEYKKKCLLVTKINFRTYDGKNIVIHNFFIISGLILSFCGLAAIFLMKWRKNNTFRSIIFRNSRYKFNSIANGEIGFDCEKLQIMFKKG